MNSKVLADRLVVLKRDVGADKFKKLPLNVKRTCEYFIPSVGSKAGLMGCAMTVKLGLKTEDKRSPWRHYTVKAGSMLCSCNKSLLKTSQRVTINGFI